MNICELLLLPGNHVCSHSLRLLYNSHSPWPPIPSLPSSISDDDRSLYFTKKTEAIRKKKKKRIHRSTDSATIPHCHQSACVLPSHLIQRWPIQAHTSHLCSRSIPSHPLKGIPPATPRSFFGTRNPSFPYSFHHHTKVL